MLVLPKVLCKSYIVNFARQLIVLNFNLFGSSQNSNHNVSSDDAVKSSIRFLLAAALLGCKRQAASFPTDPLYFALKGERLTGCHTHQT
jgi:hypothetical protein